jgi:hypothetical protein
VTRVSRCGVTSEKLRQRAHKKRGLTRLGNEKGAVLPKRNLDGTIRNSNEPQRMTPLVLIARWVEAEILKQKVLGVSCAMIAAAIGRAG